jgi:hypothetical protein
MKSFFTKTIFLVANTIKACLAIDLILYPPAVHDAVTSPADLCGAASTDGLIPTQYKVDSDFISINTTLPQTTWEITASWEIPAQDSWVTIVPQVQLSGIGAFCFSQLTLPNNWAESEYKGYIKAIIQTPDNGTFYQVGASEISFL